MSRPIDRERRGITLNISDDWQTGKSGQSCNLHMLENQLNCDVLFLVGSSKSKIGAHRYILASRSPTFFQMFDNKSLSGDVTVTLRDSTPEVIVVFLRFLYTDMPTLTSEVVIGVLSLSKQYKIEALKSHCVDFIKRTLAVDNACWYLLQAHLYQEEDLFQHCLAFILTNGESVIKSAFFINLGQDLVDRIISDDDLGAEEQTVYESVIEWTKAEAKRRSIADATLRSILGKSLYNIRFPLLDISYFACVIAKGSVLTDTEKVALFRYFSRSEASAAPFNTSKRQMKIHGNVTSRAQSCKRFSRTVGPINSPFDNVIDAKRQFAVSFSCTRNIQLKGFLLYKGTKPMYQVNVKLFSGDANLLHEEFITITSRTDTVDMIPVELAKPINLKAQTGYSLSVRSPSPNLFYGIKGHFQIVAGAATFMFYECPLPDNSSTLSQGDLPGLLYNVL